MCHVGMGETGTKEGTGPEPGYGHQAEWAGSMMVPLERGAPGRSKRAVGVPQPFRQCTLPLPKGRTVP